MNDKNKLTRLTAHVVAVYVGGNELPSHEIESLIQSVYAGFAGMNKPAADPDVDAPKLTSGQIRRSITPDALISFEDGSPYKLLKRHLAARGMTPATYRAKWGLPGDYPMVAANYSAERAAIAKKLGLGLKMRADSPTVEPEATQARVRPKGRLSLFRRA